MKIKSKEMFEALGYKLYEDDIAIVFENNQGDVIAFTYKDKELVVQPTNISKSISMAELKSINMQIKELGWLEEEKQEAKQETNIEHYYEYLSEVGLGGFALVNGRCTKCSDTRCSECDFSGSCCGTNRLKWLASPYRKKYKLTQFENDLLQSYLKGNLNRCKLKDINVLNELKEKEYFKNIDFNLTINEILNNCEVI